VKGRADWSVKAKPGPRRILGSTWIGSNIAKAITAITSNAPGIAIQRSNLFFFTRFLLRGTTPNGLLVCYRTQKPSEVERSTAARFCAALAVSAFFLVGCALPQQGTDTPDEIGGTYYVNGSDSRGREYGGQLIITPTSAADKFAMQWIITGSVQTGTGTWDGTNLDAAWSTTEDFEPASGTAFYTIQDDGTLIGERTMDGIEGTGYEEAFPVRQE